MINMDKMSLEKILAECAYLRNTGSVPHRTIKEFAWFVSSSIFGSNKIDIEGNLLQKENKIEPHCCSKPENKIIEWGMAFLEYCKKEYGEEE